MSISPPSFHGQLLLIRFSLIILAVSIGPFKVVCRGRNAVIIERVCDTPRSKIGRQWVLNSLCFMEICLCTLRKEKRTNGERVDYGGFRSKSVVAEMLYTNSDVNALHHGLKNCYCI